MTAREFPVTQEHLDCGWHGGACMVCPVAEALASAGIRAFVDYRGVRIHPLTYLATEAFAAAIEAIDHGTPAPFVLILDDEALTADAR